MLFEFLPKPTITVLGCTHICIANVQYFPNSQGLYYSHSTYFKVNILVIIIYDYYFLFFADTKLSNSIM